MNKMTPLAEWTEAERIRDLPEVAEALRNFLEDAPGDNATCIVRAVMRAVADGVLVGALAEPPHHAEHRALLACADAFERSADWLDKGVLQGSSREFPLAGTRDYRIAAEAIRRLVALGVRVPGKTEGENHGR